VHGLMNVLAERLHDTVSQGAKAPESPVVVLKNQPRWEAPLSFAAELARSLARLSGVETLVVNLSEAPATEIRPLSDRASTCSVMLNAVDESLRADMARRLTEWRKRFTNVVLNPMGPRATVIAERIDAFADFIGTLAGPGDNVGVEPGEVVGRGKFIVQSAA